MEHPSPFHAGEQRVQSMLGVRESIEPWARQVVRPYLPDEHRVFHRSLPFLVVAARDGNGRPWATVLAGESGFVRSSDPEHLTIAAQPVPGDALEGALGAGAEVGLLGIDLATRRRNRVNGQIVATGRAGLEFQVGQSFGNCPQYIHERTWRRVRPRSASSLPERTAQLTGAMRTWIEQADTLFIASGHRGDGENPAFGMDASHRGGEPGFVRVESGTRLVIPDYAGNNHFNTIGNLVADPRAGLAFVDFERGSLLQITGRTTIDWDSAALEDHPGARRLVIFEVDEALVLDELLPLRWSATGASVRSLRLVEKVRESADVTSFVLAARDGGPLPDFVPGQHLPVELGHDRQAMPIRRTYSLSAAPGGDRYRITVKREPCGLASRILHDALEVGATIDAGAPAGDFTLGHDRRPVVLVSAGVGITPMVAMLHALADPAESRRVWFIHGARDAAHHPLADEVRSVAEGNAQIGVHVAYSRPAPGDRVGYDYQGTGRVDGALLASLVPVLEAEFYLCGPTAFMAQVVAALRARGVADRHIHTETFGAAG